MSHATSGDAAEHGARAAFRQDVAGRSSTSSDRRAGPACTSSSCGTSLARSTSPARVPVRSSAESAESAAYVLWAVTIGMPDDNAGGIAQARALVEAMRPWSTGSRYLNFAPDDGHPERSFTAPDWIRLQQVKAAADPANLFRVQQPLIAA